MKYRHNAQWRRSAFLCASLFLTLPIMAQDSRPIHVNVNSENVVFTGMAPQQVQGRVMIPVRGVLEKLGAQVTWVGKTQEVVATNGKVDITLKIGSREARVNGRIVPLDVPAQIISGSTMVPLRFVGEAMGADIKWDGGSRTVLITTAGATPNVEPRREPRQEPHREPRQNISIDSVNLSTTEWLHAGSALTVTLRGTQGGQASFRIPGLVEEVALQEGRSGEYRGAWIVPDGKRIQITNARVLGSLRYRGDSAPALQSSDTVRVDTVQPEIRDIEPEDASRASVSRPNIYAVFEDRGSGVDLRSIRLSLDNRDVTATANVTRNFIAYTPSSSLRAGTHTVQLTVGDRAQNQTIAQWQFSLDAATTAGITSVNHNANRPLEPGDVLHVKAMGIPRSRVLFSVGNIKGVKMTETATGTYEADYTIRKGDDTSGSRLSVRLISPSGEKFSHGAGKPIDVRTGRPTAPRILYPGNSSSLSSTLNIRGTATPYTNIKIRIDYRGKLAGLVTVKGSALDTVVSTNRDGAWETQEVNLRGIGSGVEYTLTAISVNAAGEESPATVMTFRTR